jgi:enamine deaminase RidA (YjgF/YER057c/UK114 family)
MREGSMVAVGKVGTEVSAEQATDCARQAALNAIAAVASQVDLDDVVGVVKVVVYVASSPDFTAQPAVPTGPASCSGQVFGEAGRHARSAVGVTALPLDAPVEVEIVVEVA